MKGQGHVQKKVGEEPKKEYEANDLAPAQEKLKTIEQGINDIFVQQKFFESRKSAQNDRIMLCLLWDRGGIEGTEKSLSFHDRNNYCHGNDYLASLLHQKAH